MILFDFSYFMHRIVHPNKDKILENNKFFSHLIVTQVLQFVRKFGASKHNRMVLCLDSPSWRKEFYLNNKPNTPDYENQVYKGNRTKDSDLPWDHINSTVDDLAEAFHLFSDFHVMKVENAEADDIIAVLAKEFSKTEQVYVLSPDKDFAQLIGKNIKVYDPLKNAFKAEQDAELFTKLHAIMGDRSDNVYSIKPNVKETKETVALKIYKDLDSLLKTNPEMKARYEFNKVLVDFNCIPDDVCDSILEEYTNQQYNYNATGLMKTFMKYGLAEHASNVQQFKLSENKVDTSLNSQTKVVAKNNEISRGSIEDFFA